MKKRIYRAIVVNQVNVESLREAVAGRRVVLGIDVAKTKQVAALMTDDGHVHETVKWTHSAETEELLTLIGALPSVEAVLEPTGTYGDSLRHRLNRANVPVYRVSAKRVHDFAEVYDGVPSSHDAKSAAMIAKLHIDNATRLWAEKTDERRRLAAALRMHDRYDKQHSVNLNRLEAELARYWPERTQHLDLTSVTLLTLLIAYGGPGKVAAHAEEAAKLMRKTGGASLNQKRIDGVLSSAASTEGVSMLLEEQEALKDLAEDTDRARLAATNASKRVEGLMVDIEAAKNMAPTVGKVTAAMVVNEIGDPTDFGSAGAYLKAAGMNLKERSSGKKNGQLGITKRGSARARRYIYLAALRLIYRDAVVGAWYAKKVEKMGGTKIKAVVAVMRKLMRALWCIGRTGDALDATRLFQL